MLSPEFQTSDGQSEHESEEHESVIFNPFW